MIAILSSYTELLNKLTIDEKTKTIKKTMEDARKESTMYEEKYADKIIIFEKLRKIKSEILEDDIKKELNNNPHLYSIPEINEINHVMHEEIDTIKSLKRKLASNNNGDTHYNLK